MNEYVVPEFLGIIRTLPFLAGDFLEEEDVH